jgi:hypothetical protein
MVEMSGIEPESERFDPRTSTSVAGSLGFASGSQTGQGGPLASRWGPKAPLSHA